MPTENRRRGDSIALTKSLLIAVRKLFYTGLASPSPSVTPLPRGEAYSNNKSQRTFRALAFLHLTAYWMPVTL
jgi:hypothetical protein